MEPGARFGTDVGLGGAVGEGVVRGPRAEIVVEGFRVDDALGVDEAHLTHERLVDGVVHVTGLNEELVGEDALVGGVGEPAFLGDAVASPVLVERFLETCGAEHT